MDTHFKKAALFLFLVATVLSAPYILGGAEIKSVKGRPTLFIRDSAVPPFAYMSYLPEIQYYREVATAGIHLYCFPAYLGDRGINSTSGIGPFRPSIWRGQGQLDFSSIADDFDKILKADPQASVIIRLHLDVPLWWEKVYPEECSLQPDGTRLRQSFSSPVWRQQAGKILQECVEWLLSSPYEKHLVGIQVAAGFTEEWFYHFRGPFNDLSTPRTRAFRKWLRRKYENSTPALRKSWNNPDINFSNALPADITGEARENRWRNPDTEGQTLDTFRFHTQTMADNIAHFCRIVKDASNRALLTGAFYGYHFFVTDPRRGHGALTRLLQCPDLDYLSSPNTYNRQIGEDWPPMAAIHSVLAHGKLWMAENDTRTSLTTLLKEKAPGICPPGQYESSVWRGPPDIESSAGLMLKDAARMLCNGYGGWWFDMWGGWFSHPEMLKIVRSTNLFYNKYEINQENIETGQVCVFTDEELHFLDASFGGLAGKILSNRSSLGKTGTPYQLYLRCDTAKADSEKCKVVWLLGFPSLSPEESGRIDVWLASGKTVLWTNLGGTVLFKKGKKPRHYANRLEWKVSDLRHVLREAGVHIYIDSGDILYAGNGWLSLHTAVKGKKLIRLPSPVDIVSPFTGKTVAESARSLEVKMKAGETRLFRLQKPE